MKESTHANSILIEFCFHTLQNAKADRSDGLGLKLLFLEQRVQRHAMAILADSSLCEE